MSKSVIHRALCGVCLDSKPAHFEPTCCFGCGARFESGAPLALAVLELGVASSGGGVVAVRPRHRVEFHGRWRDDMRALALVRLALRDEDEEPGAGHARES